MTKRLALLTIAVFHASLAGERYQVTLRLPPAGLFAREEMEIEFRVEDTSRPDPLGGFAPVVRAAPDAAIEMPRMPGMPKFSEAAHVEAAPGDYGIHPTFAITVFIRPLRTAANTGSRCAFIRPAASRSSEHSR